MAIKISNELIQQIEVLFKEGLSQVKISEKLGISKSTVARYIKELGLLRDRKKTKLNESVLNEIKRLYIEEKIGSTTIANKLGLNEKTVVRQLQNMGVTIRGNYKVDTDLVVKMYTTEHLPIHIIATKLKSSESKVSKILKSNGIEIYGHKMPRFNFHIFDSIDTEEKAYWLGFIFADGYIASINPKKPNYAFELSLKAEDFDHLNKFNAFMEFQGNNVKISKARTYTSLSMTEGIEVAERCRWSISNRVLWEALNSKGCTPRKSNTLIFPDISVFSSIELIRHFIRGYFDGDGSITYYNKEHTLPSVTLASKSENFMKGFVDYLPIDTKYYKCKNEMYSTSLSERKAMLFLHFIYDNATIYLDRKYNRFISFCNTYEC